MLRTEKVRSQCRLRTGTKPGKDGGTGGASCRRFPRRTRLPYRTISMPAGASISTTVSPFSLRKAQTDSAPFGVG